MEPRIDKIIRYIKELYERGKIGQIFFSYNCWDDPKWLVEIDDCEIYLEESWGYIDVIGLNKEEKEILCSAFKLGKMNEINLK